MEAIKPGRCWLQISMQLLEENMKNSFSVLAEQYRDEVAAYSLIATPFIVSGLWKVFQSQWDVGI